MKKNKMTLCCRQKRKLFVYASLQFCFLVAIFCLSGCVVSLSPKFDQSIVDNLSSSSVDVFQLLAEVSGGVPSNTHSTREPKYNDDIGKLEALKLQINARPLPHNKTVDKIISQTNERLRQRGVATLITAGDTAPSATAVQQIINNLNKMKTDDASSGLTADVVKVFQGFIVLYYDQALTYERFLNK
jgi:hypothetical protein